MQKLEKTYVIESTCLVTNLYLVHARMANGQNMPTKGQQ